jgi:hypothetical protein
VNIEFNCRDCGTAYVPSKSDLLKGPEFYRLCPECRPQEPDKYAALFNDVGAPELKAG